MVLRAMGAWRKKRRIENVTFERERERRTREHVGETRHLTATDKCIMQ
jgi:hypothetical protein